MGPQKWGPQRRSDTLSSSRHRDHTSAVTWQELNPQSYVINWKIDFNPQYDVILDSLGDSYIQSKLVIGMGLASIPPVYPNHGLGALGASSRTECPLAFDEVKGKISWIIVKHCFQSQKMSFKTFHWMLDWMLSSGWNHSWPKETVLAWLNSFVSRFNMDIRVVWYVVWSLNKYQTISNDKVAVIFKWPLSFVFSWRQFSWKLPHCVALGSSRLTRGWLLAYIPVHWCNSFIHSFIHSFIS